MRWTSSLHYFLILSILLSCSSVELEQYYAEPKASLKDYKTFDFYEVAPGDSAAEHYKDRLSVIQEEVAKYLTAKGLTHDTKDPDLLVNLGLFVQETVQTRQTDFRTDAPRYIGQRKYSWKSETVEVGRYREGTVVMDWVDREKNQLVWHFVLHSILANNPKASTRNIQKGAELIDEKLGDS